MPQGVKTEDASTLLQESINANKNRFNALLELQVDAQKKQRIPPMDLSIEGNKRSIELEPLEPQTLFTPDRLQLDFSEQAVTDGAFAAQSTLETTGPSRLTGYRRGQTHAVNTTAGTVFGNSSSCYRIREYVWCTRLKKCVVTILQHPTQK